MHPTWNTQIHKATINRHEGINSKTVIIGDFITSLTTRNRSSTQKINKETDTDPGGPNRHIQNIPSKTNIIHILFECTWNILQNRPLLSHKTSLNKFKKIGIILCIFSDLNGMKLEINHKKKSGKNTHT